MAAACPTRGAFYGGFTIANGVTIENVQGGSGNDTLIGNEAANRLTGRARDDAFSGDGGIDVLIGGAGSDTLTGGAGADIFRFEANADNAIGTDVITDFAHGSDLIDLSAPNAARFIGSSIEKWTFHPAVDAVAAAEEPQEWRRCSKATVSGSCPQWVESRHSANGSFGWKADMSGAFLISPTLPESGKD